MSESFAIFSDHIAKKNVDQTVNLD